MYVFSDDLTIGRSLEHYGEYCYPEVDLLLALLDKYSFVLDVGANVGSHTLGFAPYVSKVVAFEPDPECHDLLVKNIGMQDRGVAHKISVNPIALSDSVQEVSTQFDYGKTKVRPGGSIVQTKLDNIKGFPRIDLIKIDVEGMEYNVLKGAQNTITYFRPILFIEMQDASMNSLVFDLLSSLSYNMYWAPCATYNPDNHNKIKEDVFGKQHGVLNWLCTPEPTNTTLIPVTDRTDTIEKAVKRERTLDRKV
jgi:FkbM family methyltransferase